MLCWVVAGLLFLSKSYALVARANLPPKFDGGSLVQAATSNAENVFRDGGGGGTVGGTNIMIFSDTTTTNGGEKGQMLGFTSNTITYSSKDNAASLTDFSPPTPSLGIPFTQNETDFTSSQWDSNGVRVVIWPGTSITPVDDQTGVFVVPVSLYNIHQQGLPLYNSLVTIKTSLESPVVTRAVPQLFFANEIQWGNAGSLYNAQTKMLNFFAYDGGNLKVAQIGTGDYADRSRWQFWNGQEWSFDQPAPGDSKSIIVNDNISSGDVFWSSYYNTFLHVYMSNGGDSKFFIRYSVNGQVTGPWSDPQTLYQTIPGTQINYAGHAYPSYDPSGKTLLLTWTYEGKYTQMSTITFD